MDLNEVHVDKSGHWLNIPLNKPLPDGDAMEFLNLDTGVVTKIVRGAPDYKPGHGDLGTDCIVGFDAWGDGLTWRRLSAPHVVRHVFFFRTAIGRNGGVTDWTHDFHGTMLADNEDWITIGTHHDPSATQTGSGIYDDEISASLARRQRTHSPHLSHAQRVRRQDGNDRILVSAETDHQPRRALHCFHFELGEQRKVRSLHRQN